VARSAAQLALEASAAPPLPAEVRLAAPVPNPSRGSVAFDLELPRPARVAWSVVDVQGRVMWDQTLDAAVGAARLRWDGADAHGDRAPAGVYFARVTVERRSMIRRFALIR